jgi:hypothetical protein
VPGWHEKTKALQEEGKLRLVGIIEEQHPDRTRLFMQWKEMSWPLLHDPINLLGVEAVPLTYLIDEHGVVRYEKPSDDDLRTFLATDYAPNTPMTPVTNLPKNLVPADGSAEDLLLWEDDVDRAIVLLDERVREQPDDASAHFRLGVARRRRYDSDSPNPNDFQKAVEHWVRALELDPNQYIFRRRIQQYGPRLDKPYPFYDWVSEARQAILARGETPVELVVEPGGAELATRLEELVEVGSGDGAEPDPQGRIYRDAKPLIRTETVVVPNVVTSGEAARVHVIMRPDESLEAHWNNEVSDLVFWITPPEGWRVDRRMHRVAVPPDPVSQELRRIEFEIQTPPGFSGSTTIPAYALYYVCEDVDGTCLYRRQDIEPRIEVR